MAAVIILPTYQMGTKCEGCNGMVVDSWFMKCSQKTCAKVYHHKCISLTTENFQDISQAEKNTWVCPECKCKMPKGDNSDTPIRGNYVMDKTFTPTSYVNKERGSHLKQGEALMIDNDFSIMIMEEIIEFRKEMKSRFEVQMQEYYQLQNRFTNTETELRELKEIVKVFQQKANKVDELEARIKVLTAKDLHLESSLVMKSGTKETAQTSEEKNLSFAKVVKQNKHTVVTNGASEKQCVATKSSGVPIIDKNTASINTENNMNSNLNRDTEKIKNDTKNEEKWTEVKRKSSRYPNSEVKRGGNTSLADIRGTERMKYLHVWRLKKDTTIESMENHVKKICGAEAQVKVESIKHKTERDYASFIIGVPESLYETISLPENWAVNIEFCEWVWFRRYTEKPKK